MSIRDAKEQYLTVLRHWVESRAEQESEATGKRFKDYQAFPLWFCSLYFGNDCKISFTDGMGDGKIDAFVEVKEYGEMQCYLINAKYTKSITSLASSDFYNEVYRLWGEFDNDERALEYIDDFVLQRKDLYARYIKKYGTQNIKFIFLTNHRRNDRQLRILKRTEVKSFHQEDLIGFVVDDLDGAMPLTPDLPIHDITKGSLLGPMQLEGGISTLLFFANVNNFKKYMDDDAFGMLFARNVRVEFDTKKGINKEIADTYKKRPHEFAYSNNGLTIICDSYSEPDSDSKIVVKNPRVVNGSQTLHAVYSVSVNRDAQVLVRLIKIPAVSELPTTAEVKKRKEIITDISIRSNKQYPIKAWNLVSTDESQLGLFHFFRKQGYFYERRPGEWKIRKRNNIVDNLQRGPDIKLLAQIVASQLSYDQPGPGVARQSVKALFENKHYYKNIAGIRPAKAFDLYLLDSSIKNVQGFFQLLKRYEGLKEHSQLVLFALVADSFYECGVLWNQQALTELLRKSTKLNSVTDKTKRKLIRLWKPLLSAAYQEIHRGYMRSSRAHQRETGEYLTYNNYFKTQSYLDDLFERVSMRQINKASRQLLRMRDYLL